MGLVTCNTQGDSLTDWLNNAPQTKKDALCAALGCDEGASYVDCSGNDLPDGAAVASCADLDEVRLPAGTAGQHLILDPSGNAVWADESDGLPVGGTNGQILTINVAGDPVWADPANPFPAGTEGQHLVLDAAGNPIWADDNGLPVGGTDGQHLVIDNTGNAVWADEIPELPAGGTDGQVLIINAAGDPEWATMADSLPAGGTDGQHLVIDSSGNPAWANQTPFVFNSADSNSVALTGDGSATAPLEAQVRLNPVAGNRITVSAAGLLAEAELPPSTPADEGKLLTVDAAGEPVWEDLPPCLVETISASGTLTEDANGSLAVGAGGTVTAPSSLPIGFRVDLVGPVTVATPGSTLKSIGGDTKVVADGGATLIKISATEYWLAGALEA